MNILVLDNMIDNEYILDLFQNYKKYNLWIISTSNVESSYFEFYGTSNTPK